MVKRRDKRWRKRRVLMRVVVLLVLGFVVNVLVAWGFAAQRRAPALGYEHTVRFSENFADNDRPVQGSQSTTYSTLVFDEGPGEWAFSMHAGSRSRSSLNKRSCPGCARPVDHPGLRPLRQSLRRSLVLAHAWLSHRCDAPLDLFTANRRVRAYGWPFPGVVLVSQDELIGRDTLRADVFLHAERVEPGYAAIRIDGTPAVELIINGDEVGPFMSRYLLRTAPVLFDRVVVLPLRPITIGAALNTAFYAAALAGVWFVVGAVRRAMLRRRGRCVHCGYDLRHDYGSGCSECGWDKPDGLRADAGAPAS